MIHQKKAGIIDNDLARWVLYIIALIVAIVIITYFVNDSKIIASSFFGK